MGTVQSMRTTLLFRSTGLEVASPVEVGGQVIGVVEFGFSGEGLDQEIRAIVLQHVWQGVALMAIGGALAYALARRVTNPLQALAQVSEEIGRGNMETPVAARGAREVALLAVTLEQMRVELKRLYAGLEERVQERTHELAAANKELEAFSYSVAHDLRSPLQTIDGFSHALAEDYSSALDEQGRDYLDRVRAAARRMAQLIDDLLRLSRMTLSEMSRGPVDLSAIASDIVVGLKSSQPQRPVDFAIQGGLNAYGDARLLRVMLENLLGNAWKFTGDRAHPLIEMGKAEVDGRPAFFVRDNGAGFDASYADRLFGPFQRLHSSAEFEGHGIGLATVQRIVQRHGGRVWAESELGRGATFYFVLPTNDEE
jgi:signal transduction histidine kinase